jgi:hypothetical protein
MAGGALGGVADLANGVGGYLGAKEREEAARKWIEQAMADRQSGVNLAQNLDWSPERVRDQVGTYQRSRSPVADAFLESFVTGDNPAAVQGTRYGAKIDKADAQKRFDKNYGGWDAIRAQQRQLDQSTPWAVQNPAGFTYGDEQKAGELSRDEIQKLQDLAGVVVDKQGQFIRASSPDAEKQGAFRVFADLNDSGVNDGKVTPWAAGDANYIERIRRYLKGLEATGGGLTRDKLSGAYRQSLFDTYDNGGG